MMPAPSGPNDLNIKTIEGKLHSAKHYLEMVPDNRFQEVADLKSCLVWLVRAGSAGPWKVKKT